MLNWQRTFLAELGLPESYLEYAQKWFDPLIARAITHQKRAQGYFFLGLNGCQGSGKTSMTSYLSKKLVEEYDLATVQLSLDDFYLPRAERQTLAETIHPLLQTRGVPGTHDIPLLLDTLSRLGEINSLPVRLPVFDKASDDRVQDTHWRSVETAPRLVILEGWCLGARAQSEQELIAPVNKLESTEDPAIKWRRYVNNALYSFLPIYRLIDFWVMLKAPSFDCVLDWRREQEEKLKKQRPDGNKLMDENQLRRFIQHYQRLTEVCLRDMAETADYLLELDSNRDVNCSRWREKVDAI